MFGLESRTHEAGSARAARRAQPAKVAVAILVIAEAGPAVVATLYDVQRDTVDANAWTPEHKESSRN
jgi:hypothetical protein